MKFRRFPPVIPYYMMRNEKNFKEIILFGTKFVLSLHPNLKKLYLCLII